MAGEQKKTYTIAEIAKELGVNKATVSRALSGKGNLSEETRTKILSFAREHNYRPNAVAQSLARSRTYNLGLMLPGDSSVFDVAFFRDCLQGICKVASENSYDVLVTMDDEHPIEQMLRLVENRKIDGVIAMRSLVESPVAQVLKEKNVPFVIVGTSSDEQVIWTDNDNRRACREMTSRLIERGARKMALLGGSESFCVTHERKDGFFAACDAAGLDRNAQLIYHDMAEREQFDAAIDDILSRGADCIVCMDDYICNMALVSLRSRRVKIPEDVSLVSFYDNVLLENHIPPVTGIRFDAVELGRVACRELLELLESGKAVSRMLSGYEIVWRDSVR